MLILAFLQMPPGYMLKYVALGAIRFYQTALSPYKGYRCAYAARSGCPSCSTLGYRAIRRYGVLKGITVLRWRFEACGAAYHQLQQKRPLALGNQRGDCDVGSCDCGCDGMVSNADCCSDIGSCGRETRHQRRHKFKPYKRRWFKLFLEELRRKLRS